MKIKIGLFGGGGKMGLAIQHMIQQPQFSKELIPYIAIAKETSSLFAISAQDLNGIEDAILEDVDVWIDFSSPEGLEQLLKATQKQKTAIVSGTTGLSTTQLKQFKKSSKNRKIFWASNMSPGLWAFRQAMRGLAKVNNFDFAIEEIHHTQKKDRPSGTAKTLHEDLEKITKKKIDAPVSLRLGGVFGIHTVIGASSNEVITLQHQALNRTVFAEGALMAARWLVNQKPGYYSMEEMFLN